MARIFIIDDEPPEPSGSGCMSMIGWVAVIFIVVMILTR